MPELKRPSVSDFWATYGTYLVSSLLLILGYVHYAPGAAYSLSADHYRAWAFPAFRYSDIIWLYLRDGLDRHPTPYLDYPLEYPPLTGLLSWTFSWSDGLPAYFAFAYAALASAALLTVWALQRLDGANAWLFAASPALFFYTGHQWDMAAVAAAALGLLALQRGRDGWGVAALVVATSLKLFPIVFLVAAVVERVRDRRFRSAAGLALAFAAGTVAINLPLALANADGWSFFYRWNRDRLADSSIWVLFRDQSTADLTRWSLVAAVAGGVALTAIALRSRGPLFITLGATYLLWWLLVNKTFTTHLMLWVVLSLALLSAPWWLWGLNTAADLAGFQLGNFLNLYNVPEYRHTPLIRKAVENLYDPMQVARSVVLFAATTWGLRSLWSERWRTRYGARQPDPPWPAAPPNTARDTGQAASMPHAHGLAVGVAVTLVFGLATVLMTWPYARHLGDSTIAGFDPLLQIWLSEWIQHALATDPRGLYNANIFYPFAQTLAYTDANIPGALAAAPLRLVTGDPVATNSLLVLASFVLAAAGVYALIVHLSGNRGAGVVAGLAYAFLPYRMVHLWHLNWLEGGLLPWVLLALLRLLERPSVISGLTLGLLVAVQVLISFYFALQLILLVGIVAVAALASRQCLPSSALARGVAVAAVTAALLVVPLYVPYLNVREEQQLERGIVDAERYKALPTSYLQLAPWDQPSALQAQLGLRSGPNESLTEVGQGQHADGHRHLEVVIEDALFPGSVALVFAVIGIMAWRRRWLVSALLLTGLAAFVLSLGPTFGARHGSGPPLPYGWLFEHAPLFRSMRVPARLGGLVDLTIVLLAGLGMAAAWTRIRAVPRLAAIAAPPFAGVYATAALSALVIAELWTGGVPIEAIDRGLKANAAAEWLAEQPPGPIMIFPAESVFADPAAASVRRHYGESMFWSTRHWKPLVNGNSGFIPRAYSDFIERFVGELPRPDGTSTGRISHVNEKTARLLSQIGVRYLVFNRDQYQLEDWPAVAAELTALAEQGIVSSAGDHGRATIAVLNPLLPVPAEPLVRLFTPTLLGPGDEWAPWIGVESPGGVPAVLSLTRPGRLETAWFDDSGRILWHGARRLPLPTVMDEARLLCGASECLTSRPFDDLARLPPPDPADFWWPRKPGHYVVRLRLTGDHALDCVVDLDIVATSDDVRRQAGKVEAYRWAECRGDARYPVNNPGAVPLNLGPPSITLIDDTAVVDITVTPRRAEEMRGWFILAPPGMSDPWRHTVYRSPVQQRAATADEPAAFEWSAPLGTQIAPGIYGLTVWFHRLGPSGWEHAAGGDLGLAPIIVDDGGALRWVGPLRARLTYGERALVPGRAARMELAIDGVSSQTGCRARWSLHADDSVLASGEGLTCSEPEVTLPASVPPGAYRLQIDILADQDGATRLSDAVVVPVTVVGVAPPGSPS